MNSQRPARARTRPTYIPCFNGGATLTEAVRSAQAQSRLDELLIVDDGSTDPGTLEVLATLEGDDLTVVRQLNWGLGPARMAGVHASHADYILPLALTIVFCPAPSGSWTMRSTGMQRSRWHGTTTNCLATAHIARRQLAHWILGRSRTRTTYHPRR
jgi:hypothetical protein